jgi:hypothetical protein
MENEMFNPHKNVLIKRQTFSLMYKYKRPSMNWVLVKIHRAQTHRTAHCVPSGIEGNPVDWEGVSGYNTENLTLNHIVNNMFEECHASC